MVKEINGNEKHLIRELKASALETTAELGKAARSRGKSRQQPVWFSKVREKTARGLQVFAPTVTSLYIDDSGLKLLVIKGQQVLKWAEMPLENGMIADGVIADPAVVADKIKCLLKEQKVKGRKMIIGFSGLHCLSRITTLPYLNQSLLNEAIRHEAENELPVPLENLYLSWQTIQDLGKELKVFMIAYSRSTVDALMQTLRQARIKPQLLDLAPLAITRAVNQKTAAIVDVRASGMDIVVKVNGVPELIRSLPLPREKSLEENLPIIREELDRTINFFNTDKLGADAGSGLPVFLSGILQDQPELYQSLAEQLGYPLHSPSPDLVYPDRLIPKHYLVNIGLILKKIALKGNAGSCLVNLNALPDIYRPKPIPVEKILYALAGITAAGIIVVTSVAVLNLKSQVESASLSLQAANRTLAQKQAQQKTLNESIAGLQKNVDASTQTLGTLSASMASFGDQHSLINEDLGLAAGNIMSGMKLTSLNHNGSLVVISGTAPHERQILNYAEVLQSSGRYSEIVISSMTEDPIQRIVKFTLNLKK